jgi:hypothetical protein
MEIFTSHWIVPILVSFFLFSCTDNEQEQQVDQSYLDSQEYSDFSQEVNRESEIREKNNASLENRLQQLSACEDTNQMSIPFEVDDQEILMFFENVSEGCTVENDRQNLKMLGESRFQNQAIRWILLDRQTAYRDQELLAAAFYEDELRSFNIVGIYKENPSESIMTEVRVRNKGNTLHVTSRTTRDIFYPIDQKNTITSEYEISSNGSIRKL